MTMSPFDGRAVIELYIPTLYFWTNFLLLSFTIHAFEVVDKVYPKNTIIRICMSKLCLLQ